MTSSTTTIGLHFKQFYTDPKVWGGSDSDNWYIDDLLLTVNGEDDMDTLYGLYGDNFENLPDNAVVAIENGYIQWQGRGAEPARADGGRIIKAFDTWMDAQTRTHLVASFDLPKDMDAGRLRNIVGVLTALGANIQGAGDVPTPSSEEQARIQGVIADLLEPTDPVARRTPKP